VSTSLHLIWRTDHLFDDLISEREPPPNRAGSCTGGVEHHLTEGAVMMAYALHLLRTVPDLRHVAIHPDGEHGKRFDFAGWLGRQGFTLTRGQGTTSYGGLYSGPGGRTLLLNPASGRFDVLAETEAGSVAAECKGGVINTKHAGQTSRLRKGLCEAVGMLLQNPVREGQRQVAVVPLTPATEALGRKMAARARAAGIEIALVDGRGNVVDLD
jgi:hypothetical protein